MKPIHTVVSARSGADIQAAAAFVEETSQLWREASFLSQSLWSAKAMARIVALSRDLEFVLERHPRFDADPAASGWLKHTRSALAQGLDYGSYAANLAFERLDALRRRWRPAETQAFVQAVVFAASRGRNHPERALDHHVISRELPARPGSNPKWRRKKGVPAALRTGVSIHRWSHGLAAPRATFRFANGDLSRVVEAFDPTPAMVAALATAGDLGRKLAEATALRLPERVAPVAWAWLAVGSFRAGDLGRARRCLERATTASARDLATVEMVRASAEVGDLEHAEWLCRSVTAAQQHSVALTHVGFGALAAGDMNRTRRCFRQALRRVAAPSPETWMLSARLEALSDPEQARTGVKEAVAGLRGLASLRRRAPSVMPPNNAPLTSLGVVVRELLALWVQTGQSSLLGVVPKAWAAECVTSPEVLVAPVNAWGASGMALQARLADLPSDAYAVFAEALQCAGILDRADTLDPGRALSGLERLAPVDGSTDETLAKVWGALSGPAWSGRPTAGRVGQAYNEGRSLAPNSKTASKSLAKMARRQLGNGIDAGATDAERATAASAIRVLENLGGTRERDLLRAAAMSISSATSVSSASSLGSPMSASGLLDRTMNALLRVDPRGVVGLLWKDYRRLCGDSLERMTLLERRGAIPRGWTAALERLLEAVASLGVEAPYDWWDRFARAWWERRRRPLPTAGLRLVSEDLHKCPETTVDRFLEHGRLPRVSNGELLERLLGSEDLLIRLRCSSRGAIAKDVTDADWWLNMLAQATETPRVSPRRIADFEALLGDRASLRDEAEICELPPLGFREPLALSGSTRQLRLLSKRDDMLAYLRLTESVTCCLSNARRSFPSWQALRVATLWRDPLSFAFQLERVSGERQTADGFVFGSLGASAGRVVVLLNGLYLNRQTASARAQILELVEDHWARPLGAVGIGVASRYGGSGPLPEDYRRHTVNVRRGCGLVGEPNLYDDLGLRDVKVTVSTDLYWKLWGHVELLPEGGRR